MGFRGRVRQHSKQFGMTWHKTRINLYVASQPAIEPIQFPYYVIDSLTCAFPVYFVCCSIFIVTVHVSLICFFCPLYIHIYSFGFLGPCCSLWGSFWIPSCGYPCARFGPLLLSFWNQDSYSWLKLPIFGCIQFLYNLEPRGRSP